MALGATDLVQLACTPREVTAFLEQTPWAQEFDANQIRKLAPYLEVHEAPGDSVVFREGDKTRYLCLVVSGSVEVVKEDSTGRKKAIATLGPGKTFGEMSLIDKEPRSATVITDDNVVLLALTIENYHRLRKDLPGLCVVIITMIAKSVSQRLRRTSGILVDYLDGK